MKREPTLAEALLARGYTYTPAIGAMYANAVIRSGRIVHVGTAGATWKWLHRLDRKVGR